MIDYIRFSFSGINRNKLRFTLNVLSITVGVFLTSVIIILSGSFKDKMYNEMKVSDEKVLTIALGDKSNTLNYTLLPVFNETQLKIIAQNPNIINVNGIKGLHAQEIIIDSEYGNKKPLINNVLYGADRGYFNDIGVTLNKGKFYSTNNDAIIGANIAKVSDVDIGDSVEVKYNEVVYKFTICGIFEEQKLQSYSSTPSMINNMIVIPVNSAIFDNMKYISISAKINDVTNIENVSNDIALQLNSNVEFKQLITNTSYEAVVISRKDVLNMIDGWFNYINLFIVIICIFVAIISITGIINTMFMNIYERTQEIGVMKAIGASNSQVSMFYIFECLLIGIIGTSTGLLMGLITPIFITHIIGWRYNPTSLVFFLSPILGIGSALFSGYVASRKVAKLEPADALTFNRE